MHLTCAAAVAMCDALEAACSHRPGIKWTNDLVCGKLKLGGILTELGWSSSGRLDYDARIIQYELREGVMIPVLTKITQNGEKMESRITSYKLNVEIPETDFIPPVF